MKLRNQSCQLIPGHYTHSFLVGVVVPLLGIFVRLLGILISLLVIVHLRLFVRRMLSFD